MKRFTFCRTATVISLMGLAACDSEMIVGPDQPVPAATPEARFSISSDAVRDGTPEEGIASITDLVRGLVAEGSLSRSVGGSLTVELDGAALALTRGATKETINKMTDFVLILCGIGTTPFCGIETTPLRLAASAEVELLITSGQTVIDQLETIHDRDGNEDPVPPVR